MDNRLNRLSTEQVAQMDLATAENEISNRIIEATYLLEQLEHAGKIRGNSHHTRQSLAASGVDAVRARWVSDEEVVAHALKSAGPGPVRMNAEGWATAAPTPRNPLSPGSTIE